MNIEEKVHSELNKLGFNNCNDIKITEIRNKDGVFLFRINTNGNSYVLKYFVNDKYKREIKNYEILKSLGVKTINDYGYTDSSILLEDIEVSEKYRLGISEDLKDKKVAKALVNWYMDLHNKGVNFIKASEDNYYSELNEITIENIEITRLKSDTMNNPVWSVILNNFEIIKEKINSLEQTLNYNDFYWTNLVVSTDKSEAFMFDYNFLGTGFRYCDIRNVCSSLSKEAGEIFLKQYGYVSTKEKTINDFTSEISTLILAYKKEIFPFWAKDSLDSIANGKLEATVKRILEL